MNNEEITELLYRIREADDADGLALLCKRNESILEDRLERILFNCCSYSLQSINCGRWLLSSGKVRVDIPAKCGKSPLMEACYANSLDFARLFLEFGADVNLGTGGLTPLSLAVSEGNLELVKYLVEHGASLVEKVAINGFGPRTIIEIANGFPEVEEYLKSVAPELAVMEKVETVDPRKDLPFTYETLTEMIADASQKAFSAMVESRPDEQFYGFAICTDDDASTIFPAGNTEESLAETDPEYRYFTNEWSCGVGVEFFDSAQEYLGKREDDNAELTLRAFVEGLKLADSRGVFGTGEARKRFILMAAGSDPDEDLEIKMEEWTKELNPFFIE